MSHAENVRRLAGDPEQLELAYREALKSGEAEDLAAAIHAIHAELPDDRLFAAWHFRLLHGASRAARRAIAWTWAAPVAAANALVLWLVSDHQRFALQVTNPATGEQLQLVPVVALVAAPIAAAAVVWFLAVAGDRLWRRALAVAASLAALTAYVLLTYSRAGPRVYQEQYLVLMVLHLALLSWAGIGAYALIGRRDAANRFAFLLKSLEYVVVGGLAGIIGGAFTAVTFGLFDALGIAPPETVVRLFVFGGAGLIAVLAAALVVDPRDAPARQPFDDGPSRLVALLLRLLLPLALAVLAVYLAFVPANFRAPFETREVLIAYNAMLFAVVSLLIGAAPLHGADLDERARRWLRYCIIALAALALVIGVYALGAIVYRTLGDRPTPNRVAFIGWNVVNIAVLAWVLARQWRSDRRGWLTALHRSFVEGVMLYAAWSLVALLALPWLFGIDQGDIERLPDSIQKIVFEEPYPILLKCSTRPEVYLLEKGRKRWITDIPTFEAEGFRWSDVVNVSCNDLAGLPQGEPIPPGANDRPDE